MPIERKSQCCRDPATLGADIYLPLLCEQLTHCLKPQHKGLVASLFVKRKCFLQYMQKTKNTPVAIWDANINLSVVSWVHEVHKVYPPSTSLAASPPAPGLVRIRFKPCHVVSNWTQILLFNTEFCRMISQISFNSQALHPAKAPTHQCMAM